MTLPKALRELINIHYEWFKNKRNTFSNLKNLPFENSLSVDLEIQ